MALPQDLAPPMTEERKAAIASRYSSWRLSTTPCPVCHYRVPIEKLQAHIDSHCPVPGCKARFTGRFHNLVHLRDQLVLPDLTTAKEREMRRFLDHDRWDLVLQDVFDDAEKQGRILAVNKIPNVPCGVCGQPIALCDIIEKMRSGPVDVLERRKRPGVWAHFSCPRSRSIPDNSRALRGDDRHVLPP